MSTRIDVNELPSRFREAMDRLAVGDEVVLTDGTEPRARLAPLAPSPAASVRPRTPGLHAGAMTPAADFDAPLPDDFWVAAP